MVGSKQLGRLKRRQSFCKVRGGAYVQYLHQVCCGATRDHVPQGWHKHSTRLPALAGLPILIPRLHTAFLVILQARCLWGERTSSHYKLLWTSQNVGGTNRIGERSFTCIFCIVVLIPMRTRTICKLRICTSEQYKQHTQAFLADYQRCTCSMSVKKLQLQSFLVTFVTAA